MSSARPDISEELEKAIGKPLKKAVSLKDHSHFRIGGPADYFLVASTVSELVRVIQAARDLELPYYVIGGGYNLLFDDEGFKGLIVKNQVQGVKKRGEGKVEALSGTSLSDLVQFCVQNSWKGFEFLAGIPGTVGGAVFGNAGAFDQAIGTLLSEALVLDEDGEEVRVDSDHFGFDYRSSRLRSNGELLLKADFVLEEGTKEEIEARIREILEKRKSKHPPWDVACAGSFFKNPVLPEGRRIPAASFLDQVGAKSLAVGGAEVFAHHANFIINRNEATARDVLSLAQELKTRVKKTFGVELEEEVIFLPAKPSKP
jgi:UDP-N-acetylmuramate dehydrogenase